MWSKFLLLATAFLAQSAAFDWHIPKPFPRPAVASDNPMNAAKVELGR